MDTGIARGLVAEEDKHRAVGSETSVVSRPVCVTVGGGATCGAVGLGGPSFRAERVGRGQQADRQAGIAAEEPSGAKARAV